MVTQILMPRTLINQHNRLNFNELLEKQLSKSIFRGKELIYLITCLKCYSDTLYKLGKFRTHTKAYDKRKKTHDIFI